MSDAKQNFEKRAVAQIVTNVQWKKARGTHTAALQPAMRFDPAGRSTRPLVQPGPKILEVMDAGDDSGSLRDAADETEGRASSSAGSKLKDEADGSAKPSKCARYVATRDLAAATAAAIVAPSSRASIPAAAPSFATSAAAALTNLVAPDDIADDDRCSAEDRNAAADEEERDTARCPPTT